MRCSFLLPVSLGLLLGLACNNGTAGEKIALTDLLGDPLPKGAIARLGSNRLQHAGEVHALVYSADGKRLASAGADKVIRIWDAQTGKALQTLEGHKGHVNCLAFVPAASDQPEQVLVSAGSDKTIRFWDLKTGKELDHTIHHPGPVKSMAVSPDGKLLASGGDTTAEAVLWQVTDGKEVRRWKAHRGGVVGLAFAPDGKTLASGGLTRKQTFPEKAGDPKDDYGVAIWETDTGKATHALSGHTSLVEAIAFSADGKLLASVGIDKIHGRSVILWDPASGQKQRALDGGPGGLIYTKCLALSRDSKTLAVGDNSHIQLWDIVSGMKQTSIVRQFGDKVNTLAFSPDGQSLASAGRNGRITLWNVQQRTAKTIGPGHTQYPTSVTVSPDGKTIATTSSDGTWLWDRATSKTLLHLKGLESLGRSSPRVFDVSQVQQKA